ncbi:MAG: GAF domain-containing sensor histidine kinase [Leptolyngbya sp. SIO3F4]|nr:GAF domain-containing sensor histidine kinase [Leptolyngbya sp. SIO3F4]
MEAKSALVNSELNCDTSLSEAIGSDQTLSSCPSSLNSKTSLVEEVLAIIQRGDSTKTLLQWLPQTLVSDFDLQGCYIELYDEQHQTVTFLGGVGCSEATKIPKVISQHWEYYQPLTLGKSLQFSSKTFGAKQSPPSPLTWLGCPMMKPSGLLGSVWLSRPGKETFNESESQQLQQIVNCVAIAFHQADLKQIIAIQNSEIELLRTAKDEFLKLISHELFVPLGNIQLSTQTLDKIFKDAAWRKVPQRNTVLKILSLLNQECRRQKQFVDNLITLMFPEYQKASEPVLMNLSDWLTSLIRTFEPRFEQESLNLKTTIPSDPLLFECDVAQLERIITELVNNAIKYTPAKKTVMIAANIRETAVEIAIANTGVHIPANHQPHIFEKFYRVPELDQRQYGGSGLGLALVKQLVTNLDGTIEVKSTKQKTTFTVKLPK